MTVDLARALLDALDDEALDLLAEKLAPRLALEQPTTDAWLTVDEAADYLRCGKSRIYSLTSCNRIPHVKDGSRTLFRRSALDAWLAAGGGKRP